MQKTNTELDPELRQVLQIAYKFLNNNKSSESDGSFCYTWIVDQYHHEFGTKFHQSKLAQLERKGLLKKLDTARGGKRRYYTFVDPKNIAALME